MKSMLALSVKTIKKKTAAEAQNPNAFAAGVDTGVCKKWTRACVWSRRTSIVCASGGGSWPRQCSGGSLCSLTSVEEGVEQISSRLPPPPHPPRAGVEEVDEIRACFPMLLPRQEPAGGRLWTDARYLLCLGKIIDEAECPAKQKADWGPLCCNSWG